MLLKHLRSYFITSFWIIFDIQICTVIIKHPHPYTIVILMRLISVSAGFLFKSYFLNKSEQQYTHPLC
jgi:tetrahydromethanopterin S-methyltransferase subunit E